MPLMKVLVGLVTFLLWQTEWVDITPERLPAGFA